MSKAAENKDSMPVNGEMNDDMTEAAQNQAPEMGNGKGSTSSHLIEDRIGK